MILLIGALLIYLIRAYRQEPTDSLVKIIAVVSIIVYLLYVFWRGFPATGRLWGP